MSLRHVLEFPVYFSAIVFDLILSAAVVLEDAESIARSVAQNRIRYRKFASIMHNASLPNE